MTPELWKRVREVFERAVALEGDDRGHYLASACCDDDELRREVLALLRAHEGQHALLDGRAPATVLLEGAQLTAGSAPTVAPGGTTAGAHAPLFGKVCRQCGARYPATSRFCASDAMVLDDDVEGLVGSTFDGQYVVEGVLGRGGMGVVYRARHTLLHDVVAIKVLPREMSSDETWLARFLREGQAARLFRHPSAVTVYDLRITDDGTVYLVLEYVPGRTLRAELAEAGRLAPHDVVDLLRPVAGALDAAHRKGVVHRDLKPENVMVGDWQSGGGRLVKLLDLGIARIRPRDLDGEEGRLTRAGSSIGTPAYMAPEQWGAAQRDGVADVDGRADVYALGLIAFELVTGRPPYLGRSVGEMRDAHLSAVPPRLDELDPSVPPAFGLAVARAMAKDREDRFATAGELLRALDDAVGGEVTIESLRAALRKGAPTALASRDGAARGGELPWPATSFVGRSESLESVLELLSDGRLVTLTGSAGIGKTRLAIEAARRASSRFSGGTAFVAHMGAGDTRARIAAALGGHASEAIGQGVGGEPRLLVLDACADAAADVAWLLSTCPDVRLIATARAALGVEGECVWRVPALPASEAVTLFVDRVSSARPGIAIGGENRRAAGLICAMLDGVPLAIEIVAARAGEVPIGRVAAELEVALGPGGAPSRAEALRRAIDWSLRRLSSAEREALAAYAAGGVVDRAALARFEALALLGLDGLLHEPVREAKPYPTEIERISHEDTKVMKDGES